MIIDCFTFFNELDLLEIRLKELSSVVDYFVLVEANKTQSLKDKPYYFETNKNRYSEFSDKIIHVKVDDCPSNSQNLWEMENFQRNCIKRGLSNLNLCKEDLILISDLDEIPSSKIIKYFKSNNITFPVSIDMSFYAYFINLKAKQRNWVGTVAVPNDIFQKNTPQEIRSKKDFFVRTEGAFGWHFSWLGGYEKVYEKAFSCIEPFNKEDLPSKENFKEYFDNFLLSKDKFFIHLENLKKQETEFVKVDIDENYPVQIVHNIELYKKFILE